MFNKLGTYTLIGALCVAPAAVLAACLAVVTPVAAQGAPNGAGTVELLNQITALRSELQALRSRQP